MAMNPIQTTKTIKSDYENYLQSILKVKNKLITKRAYDALRRHKFVKGPFLEATMPYISGKSMGDLIDAKIASKEFLKLHPHVDIHRPLYIHQEEAFIKSVVEQRNIIVATGTGSGKTESFLYPILHALMTETEQETLNPGVRALLLYPMNALANDQMKRLRETLASYPDITFGRYTGETLEKEAYAVEAYKRKRLEEIKAQNPFAREGKDYHVEDILPLANERLSREKMREDPPQILLTNYAMLEYLLLRPSDNVFFDGVHAKKWQFIVLDEAHSYKGATGTEIALLLRRLKQRVVGNKKGKIRCMATSATLGNKDALPDLAKFASDIFDEDFRVEDIITSKRKKVDSDHTSRRCTFDEYQSFIEAIKGMDEETSGAFLYEKLSADRRIAEIIKLLEVKPKDIADISKKIFDDVIGEAEQGKALAMLIELGVRAKRNTESSALLPARYHLFVKALEGVYVAFYPETQVFLDRKEVHRINGREVPVFELANCQNCGQEYLVGLRKGSHLKPAKTEERTEYYLLTDEEVYEEEPELNEDDASQVITNVSKLEAYELCTACGEINVGNRKQRIPCCDVKDTKKLIKVYKMTNKAAVPNTCASCGSVSKNLIKRFLTANQPATYVIANSLYSMITPEKTDELNVKIEDEFFFDEQENLNHKEGGSEGETGRKLLVFSDNRQEAAFFAAYMDNKYNQLMWRRLIISHLKASEQPEPIPELMIKLRMKAEKANLFRETDESNSFGKDLITQTYVMKELLGFERQQGLEGSGYIQFAPMLPVLKKGIEGFSANELMTLIRVVLDSIRISGGISFPDYLNPEDDSFAPRDRKVYFRSAGSGAYRGKVINSFMPSPGHRNKRSDYVVRALMRKGVDAEEAKVKSLELLKQLHEILTHPSANMIVGSQLDKEGSVYQLKHERWTAKYIQDDDKVWACDKCGKIAHNNIADTCPEFRCQGRLDEVQALEFREDPYLSKAYENDKIIPMLAKEHTAQLNKEKAGDLQKAFENGQVNVLSCSTTFEMGVDVGQLEAIFLRNVPPETANYVQRAGRAGRRTSSTAFSVTFARRSSHDLHYFSNPADIISGKIKSPYVETTNEKIAGRHLNSIVMAWFFKQHPQFFDGKVRKIIGLDGGEDIVLKLKSELDKRPEELAVIIEEALGSILSKRLGVKDWSFATRIVGENGILNNAVLEKKSDIDQLEQIRMENFTKGRPSDSLERLKNTYLETSVLNFMASSGVLPKYGFPVDVVKLDIINDNNTSLDVDLSRDLKLAISEYAPKSEVIAAGKVWTSHALNKVRGKEWPTYHYYECSRCRRIEITQGLEIAVEDDVERETPCPYCSGAMKAKKYVVPIFGFSTMYGEKPKRVGDARPSRYYSTKIQFGGFDKLDEFQEAERKQHEIRVGGKDISALYSPQGKLVVLNRGKKNSGLFLCKRCGYASDLPTKSKHKNKFGKECSNTYMSHVALGHFFNSDVLRIHLPNVLPKGNPYDPEKDQWNTLLYAILEGASDVLGISRADINGCVDWSEGFPILILFDEASGGAGHVKHLYHQFDKVLKGAYKRVDGHCGCGDETSCYGCLRSYSNQMEHDELARGLAKLYLEWLFDQRDMTVPSNSDVPESTMGFTKEWEDALELLTGECYDIAMDMASTGKIAAPDEVGFELISKDQGVLGFEAEIVWEAKRVALLNEDTASEAHKRFADAGWTVYTPNSSNLSEMYEELQVKE